MDVTSFVALRGSLCTAKSLTLGMRDGGRVHHANVVPYVSGGLVVLTMTAVTLVREGNA